MEELTYNTFERGKVYMNNLINDDNGIYNFGDLDVMDETAVGDYDFADLTEGADPDTVAIGNFDFNIIINEINAFIIKMIKLGVYETMGRDDFQVFERAANNEAGMMIYYQFYYNINTDTVFIEYNFNQNFLDNFDEAAISRNIEKYIKANMNKDIIKYMEDNKYVGIKLWPKIVFINGNDTNTARLMLTPSTIGYWTSLVHKYVFINDPIQMRLNMASFINKLPDDYQSAIHAIFDMYYTTDFATFTKKYYEALQTYHIDFNSKFIKHLSDYVADVLRVANEYHQVALTEDQKIQHMHRYAELYHEYHTDMPLFEQKIEELNNEFGIISDINSLLPTVFEKYNEVVHEYFGVDLPLIEDTTIGGYIELYLNK